jgi:hypothetical protein
MLPVLVAVALAVGETVSEADAETLLVEVLVSEAEQ